MTLEQEDYGRRTLYTAALVGLSVMGGAYFGYHTTVSNNGSGALGTALGAAGGWIASAGLLYAASKRGP